MRSSTPARCIPRFGSRGRGIVRNAEWLWSEKLRSAEIPPKQRTGGHDAAALDLRDSRSARLPGRDGASAPGGGASAVGDGRGLALDAVCALGPGCVVGWLAVFPAWL